MLEYILNTTPGTTDATEFIELVKEHTAAIAFSKDGAQVVMRCLALGNAKARRNCFLKETIILTQENRTAK
jgi:pumilio family protein 6